MLIETIGLREIPDRPKRMIRGSAANNSSPGVWIAVFVRPLGNVSFQVERTERTGPGWKIIYVRRWVHHGARVRRGQSAGIPAIAPRVKAIVGRLRSILPLPLVRKALASPLCISPGIFD